MDIEPLSLSELEHRASWNRGWRPEGSEVEVGLGWKKTPFGTTAEYNRPSGAVRTEEGRRIESVSVGKHEWSFGKRDSRMTQEVLGALPELGSRAGRAVLRWNKASRLMRGKTSTDIVKFEFFTM